jgi:hypothetical protein
MHKWRNVQFFSEQMVESLHHQFNTLVLRVTNRDENYKAKRVMEWIFHRNIAFDCVRIEQASDRVPMSGKQRSKFKREFVSQPTQTLESALVPIPTGNSDVSMRSEASSSAMDAQSGVDEEPILPDSHSDYDNDDSE